MNDVFNFPDRGSSAQKWILWHKSLRKELDLARANSLWLKAWEMYGEPNKANEYTLRDYMTKEAGIDMKNGIDVVFDAGKSIFSRFKLALSFVQILLLSVVAVLTILFFKLLWALLQNPVKTIKEGVIVGAQAAVVKSSLKRDSSPDNIVKNVKALDDLKT